MIGHRKSLVPGVGSIIVLILLAFAPSAHASDLYSAKTIVTGQREETRLPGFSKCLGDVLVKVSGDPTLIDDAEAAETVARANELVSGYRYRDRLEGLPVHDEQGSRDRPYDLTVSFDPEKIDRALRSLGREPWTTPRPTLALFISVRNDTATYLLASDGRYGIDQREALAAAAWQMGIPMALPGEGAMARAGLTFETLPAARSSDLKDLAAKSGGSVPLVGYLIWSKGTLGWLAEWHLTWKDKTYHWRIKDVNFDDAFRNAMRGAAQIVSGNGRPR